MNIVFKNWSIEAANDNFRAHELSVSMLTGNVYGHPSFPDGLLLRTSRIVAIEDMGDHKDVITRSGSRYSVYPDDVAEGAEETFPDYYNRLSIVEVGTNGREG